MENDQRSLVNAFDDVVICDPGDEQTQPAFLGFEYRDTDTGCSVARRHYPYGLSLDLDGNAVRSVRSNIELIALLDLLIQLKKST